MDKYDWLLDEANRLFQVCRDGPSLYRGFGSRKRKAQAVAAATAALPVKVATLVQRAIPVLSKVSVAGLLLRLKKLESSLPLQDCDCAAELMLT